MKMSRPCIKIQGPTNVWIKINNKYQYFNIIFDFFLYYTNKSLGKQKKMKL